LYPWRPECRTDRIEPHPPIPYASISPLAAGLLQFSTAISCPTSRREPIINNRPIHALLGPIPKHVWIMLSYEPQKLRRVNGCYVIVRVKLYPGHFSQVVDDLRVLAAAEREIVAVQRLKLTNAPNSNRHLVPVPEKGSLEKGHQPSLCIVASATIKVTAPQIIPHRLNT